MKWWISPLGLYTPNGSFRKRKTRRRYLLFTNKLRRDRRTKQKEKGKVELKACFFLLFSLIIKRRGTNIIMNGVIELK